VGAIVDALVSRKGWSEHMRFGRLQAAWPDVVGAHIASRSQPVALEGGTLQIRADGSAWATELTLMSASIGAKVAAFLELPEGLEVRVTAGGLSDPNRRGSTRRRD
jgi:predicted nucleic acid-binding Zn ribbon protein